MNNKLQAKDLINLGLFTVLYFVLGCCVAIPIGFVPIFLPILGALWTLITGIPFMLFLTRVKKFGMVTLMAILSGLLMGLTGMGYWGVPLGLIFGLLGDLILKFGNYKSAKRSLIGYGAVIAVVGLLSGIYHVYAAMVIGQLSNGNRFLFAFVAYAVLSIIVSLIGIPSMANLGNMGSSLQNTFGFDSDLWIYLVENIVIIIIYHIVTEVILTKKLNLE